MVFKANHSGGDDAPMGSDSSGQPSARRSATTPTRTITRRRAPPAGDCASRQNIPEGRIVPNSDEQGLTTPASAPDGARAGENGAAAPAARRSRATRPRRATSEASAAAAALGAALPDLAASAAPATPSAPARIPRRRGNAGRTPLPAVPATAIDAPVVAPDLVAVPGAPAATAEAPVAAMPEEARSEERRVG